MVQKVSFLKLRMDDDGLNMRNWGYYEPSFKEHLGLQLMSPMGGGGGSDAKPPPFPSPRENPLMVNPTAPPPFHHHHHPRLVSDAPPPAPSPLQYMRDGWIQRERLLHMLPGNPTFTAVSLDTTTTTSVPVMPPATAVPGGRRAKKRTAAGPLAKKPRKNGSPSGQRGAARPVKRNLLEVVINGVDIPIPVCSCTGVPQQCYRWGSGGWQSACCTTTISMYPLPMSTKRRGARIAGRKMSQGAFKKVLERLAAESYDFADAIDLRAHWAKHGTNKFVTIR